MKVYSIIKLKIFKKIKYRFDLIKKKRLIVFSILKIIFKNLVYVYNSDKEEVKICITTTKGYANKTINKLVNQLIKSGVSAVNIFVFEGGYEKKKVINKEYFHYQVDNNSFDLTALISIVEMSLEGKTWLLLHDTVELHWSFKYILKTLSVKDFECMPLREHPSMNIGLYSHSFLLKNKDYLLSIKNIDYTPEGLQKAKAHAVLAEDHLFKIATKKNCIYPDLAELETVTQGMYLNVNRFKEFYPQLGLIKYKANNMLRKEYVIEL